MAEQTPGFGRIVSLAAATGFAALLAAGSITPASAQQPAPAAPADQKKAGGAEQASAWIKLCEEQTLKKEKETDPAKKVNVCLTHHERFHPNTGQPLISAAIRQLDEPKQQTLMIMVPLGRLLQQGLILKVDEKEPVKMPYNYCTALGCVAEVPATPEIVTSMKKGGELFIGTMDVSRKRIAFKIPLSGFTRALDGPPIDRKVYANARKQMFEQIRKRQEALIKRAKEENAKKAAGGASAPAQAPKKLQ